MDPIISLTNEFRQTNSYLQSWLFLAMALMLCTGCGSEPSVETPLWNYNGTFSGTETIYQPSGTPSKLTATLTVILKEDDNKVSGTWSSSTGSSGTINGVIVNGIVDPISIVEEAGCMGSYSGKAFFNPDDPSENTLSGSGKASTAACGEITVFYDLIRQ